MRRGPNQIDILSPGFADLRGRVGAECAELLNITEPRAVRAEHVRHLSLGATALRTNTAAASPERLDRFRMHDEAFITSYMAAEHARDAVKGTKATVIGVARVESRSPSLGFLPLDQVHQAARTMVSGLAGGGSDRILLEAAQDPARLLAAIEGARHGMADAGRSLPIWLKLRYDPLFAPPFCERVSHDLKAAASLAAGLNLAALSVAPVNLVGSWADTLESVARVYAGPLFADGIPDRRALEAVLRNPTCRNRLIAVGGQPPADFAGLLPDRDDRAAGMSRPHAANQPALRRGETA